VLGSWARLVGSARVARFSSATFSWTRRPWTRRRQGCVLIEAARAVPHWPLQSSRDEAAGSGEAGAVGRAVKRRQAGTGASRGSSRERHRQGRSRAHNLLHGTMRHQSNLVVGCVLRSAATYHDEYVARPSRAGQPRRVNAPHGHARWHCELFGMCLVVWRLAHFHWRLVHLVCRVVNEY
jgi:hypothetical protein